MAADDDRGMVGAEPLAVASGLIKEALFGNERAAAGLISRGFSPVSNARRKAETV